MPVVIAPAPSKAPAGAKEQGQNASLALAPLSYACQSCVRRKVKCDRASPICSSCTKAKLDCVYRAPPPPRPRKRKPIPSEDVVTVEDAHDGPHPSPRERIRHNDGAEVTDISESPHSSTVPIAATGPYQPPSPRNIGHPADTISTGSSVENSRTETSREGKLLSGNGKSRYVKSRLWLDAGDMDMRELASHGDHNAGALASQSYSTSVTTVLQDPLSDMLLGVSQGLGPYHPSHLDAMKLWAAHVSNVDPLCKLLHIPSTAKMVESISQQPSIASKAQECLIFSIYHSAVFSMAEEECLVQFERSRSDMLAMYQAAVRQALVNASWLQTTEMLILQAYVLFLIIMRTEMDPHTYWILTGVAVRIAQRMGIHRDSEGDGLCPFDVEMRRRLFWQLLPLDAQVGQISGSGISILPGSWDTKPPLNINDDQIYPGMEETPQVQKGATEMILYLVKAELSDLFARTGVTVRSYGPSLEIKSGKEIEDLMDEVETTIEMNYLRYCDITNPLQFFTLGIARSAASIVRLRNRMSPRANKDIDNTKLRELCVLAHKILDTDSAIYRNPSTRKFHWQIKGFFLWDALKCILTSLARPDFYPPAELDATWEKMANFYKDHREVAEAKGAIQQLIVKATLDAWRVNPPTLSSPEPDFIVMLGSQAAGRQATQLPGLSNDQGPSGDTVTEFTSMDAIDSHFDIGEIGFGDDLNLSVADWMFWYQSA
ncbi:unnamed protein product [Clonostachys rosea f. rosea IK726]|uniref:Zn(2)-C6 fungal-type domain-containing protein n=2 Tax=Bionectria ochroleuca TaxID=29856 RepID=A0A0B7KRI6_BIOOC|nr:unnamed protein product [Clonostachys rosea f. rosea IK726]